MKTIMNYYVISNLLNVVLLMIIENYTVRAYEILGSFQGNRNGKEIAEKSKKEK